MMMKKYDEWFEINQNLNWPYIPNYIHRTLIIGSSGSDKTNVLLNLIKHQWPDVNKMYLSVKDLFESNYQLLINGREKARMKHDKNPQVFINY